MLVLVVVAIVLVLVVYRLLVQLLLLLVVIVLQRLLAQKATTTAFIVAILLFDYRCPVRIATNLRPLNRLLVLLLLKLMLLLLGKMVLIGRWWRLLVLRGWDLPVVLQVGPDQWRTVVGHDKAHRVVRVLLVLVHRWWMAFFQTDTLRIFAAVWYPPEHEFNRKIVRVLFMMLIFVSVINFRFA